MDSLVAYLLDLRLRVRRNPDAVALVDHCLQLIARASEMDSDDGTAAMLAREVEAIRSALQAQFGTPRRLTWH